MFVDIIAGTRPNFVKVASLCSAFDRKSAIGGRINYRLINTGQHYDKNMSDVFFVQLGIPQPSVYLNVGGGTQADVTSKVMIGYEKVVSELPPQMTLVVGDVNSTMAAAIVAKKAGILLGHIESGLRSNDLLMPEEINRLVTDAISDIHYTTGIGANQNLIRSGISQSKIITVGNTMIDTLLKNRKNFKEPQFWKLLALKKCNYILLTLHRPSNVDEPNHLNMVVDEIIKSSGGANIVFPVHPRARKSIDKFASRYKNLFVVDPLPYLEFSYLLENCAIVVTDSGGITEEATVLQIPCLTLRASTERPETVDIGTNILIDNDYSLMRSLISDAFNCKWKSSSVPNYWDGMAGERIVEHVYSLI